MQQIPGSHVIIKQGYLKKLPNISKIGASLKRANRRWFVFGLTQSQEPYLESYDSQDDLSTATSHKTLSLGNCSHITKSLHLKGYNNVFTLTLGHRQLSLIANTLALMDEWCHSLDTTLKALGILQAARNFYVEAPQGQATRGQLERRLSTGSQRDPTSPLPTPPPRLTTPINSNPLIPLSLPSYPTESSTSVIDNVMNEVRAQGAEPEANEEIYESLWDRTSGPASASQTQPGGAGASHIVLPAPPQIPPRRIDRQRQEVSSRQSSGSGQAVHSQGGSGVAGPQLMNRSEQAQSDAVFAQDRNNTNLISFQPGVLPTYQESENSAAALVTQGGRLSWQQSPSTSLTPQSHPRVSVAATGGATGFSFSPPRFDRQTSSPTSPLGALPPKMMEALGISDNAADEQVFGWNAPPPDNQDAPPPYMPRNVPNVGAQVSLKQTQVELLQKEMGHAGGMKVVLRKLDCHHMVAWAEAYGGVWIAGWNQKESPFLHNAFHIGDQIISINGQVVENVRMAHKLIKYSDDSAKITFILKRIPNAKVFALKRTEEGQSLGLRREGGTGEIKEVEPFGLAASHSVPAKAITMDKRSLCNWFITEINMRPINLFFKESEIEKRLNAVGKDISILIQPADFVNELKRQLKLLKNYKDFIVQ